MKAYPKLILVKTNYVACSGGPAQSTACLHAWGKNSPGNRNPGYTKQNLLYKHKIKINKKLLQTHDHLSYKYPK